MAFDSTTYMPLLLGILLSLGAVFTGHSGDRLAMPGYLVAIFPFVVLLMRKGLGDPVLPSNFVRQPVVAFLSLYFIMGLGSITFISNESWHVMKRGFPIVAWGFALYNFLPVYIYALGIKTLHGARTVLCSIIPVSFAIATLYIVQQLSSDTIQWESRSALGMQKNIIGDVAAIGAIICICLFPSFKLVAVRVSLVICSLVCFAACTLAWANAASFAVVFILLLSVLMTKHSWSKKAAMVALILFAAAAIWWSLPESRRERVAEQSSDLHGRTVYWDQSCDMIANQSKPLGWRVRAYTDDRKALNPCNLFLQSWIELGPLGFGALLGMTASAFFLFVSNARALINGPVIGRCVNFAAFGIFFERFVRDMVDYHELCNGLSMLAYASTGLAIFIKLGLERRRKAAIAATFG